MHLDVQARGFVLTRALRRAVEGAIDGYAAQFPEAVSSLQVRLFDVNGCRGGVDKGCLATARVGGTRSTVVASELDADLYRAIAAAFSKLARATRSSLSRQRSARTVIRRRSAARVVPAEH
jgi:putative sigma-54 modulation protein